MNPAALCCPVDACGEKGPPEENGRLFINAFGSNTGIDPLTICRDPRVPEGKILLQLHCVCFSALLDYSFMPNGFSHPVHWVNPFPVLGCKVGFSVLFKY